MFGNLLSGGLLAQAVTTTETIVQPVSFMQSGWVKLAVFILVIVASIVVGRVLSGGLRMPDFSWKISLITFSVLIGLALIALGWPPKLGIDLSGGVILVYQIEQGKQIEQAAHDVQRKLNADPEIKLKVDVKADEKNGRVEVRLPEKATNDDIKQLEERIAKTQFDNLTLKKLPNAEPDAKSPETPKGPLLTYQIDRTEKQNQVEMDKLVTAIGKRINPGGIKEVAIRPHGNDEIEIIVPFVNQADVADIKRSISTAGHLEFRIVANHDANFPSAIFTRAKKAAPGATNVEDEKGNLESRWVKADPEKFPVGSYADFTYRTVHGERQVLVLMDEQNVTGEYLNHASSSVDPTTATPDVLFGFNSVGADKFGALTQANLPDPGGKNTRQLGIVLDDVLLSAPNINSRISDSGQITGRFTQKEVDFVVGILNAGALPARLNKDPISEQSISAQLGEDTVRQGRVAMIVAVAVVLAFMLVYYHLSGLIACWALLVNLILTVAVMIAIKAAFTLPGLAGLVLGVAMCVDANVLIYERIREELERGAGLRMAIRNGFHRSTNTIVDSHVTTLITAVVLYWIGTDQVRGFAVTLILGLLLNMYTALFCSRVIFDIGEKRRWFSRLKLMHLFGHTKIDFMRLQKVCIPISILLIVLGLGGAIYRGSELFDIDFNGGSSVQIVLKESVPYKDVNTQLAKTFDDVVVSRVQVEGKDADRNYQVDSSIQKVDVVKKKLREAFGDKLLTYDMQAGPLKTITADELVPSQQSTGPAEKPAATDKPTHKPATTDKPAEKPVTDKPVTDKPVTDKPVTDKPVTDKAAEKPAADTPAKPTDEGTPKTDPKSPDSEPKTPEKDAPKPDTKAGAAVLRDAEGLLALADTTTDAPAADKKTDDATKKDDTAAKADDKSPDAKPKPPVTDAKTPDDKSADKSADDKPAADKTSTDKKPGDKTNPAPKSTDTTLPRFSFPGDTAGDLIPGGAPPDTSFIGGTEVELKFPSGITHDVLEDMLKQELEELKFNPLPVFRLNSEKYTPPDRHPFDSWTLMITLPKDKTSQLVDKVSSRLHEEPIFLSANTIGGKVAGDTKWHAFYAVLVSMFFIVIYIWIRFQNVVFGLGAVVALIHDVIIPVGFIAWSYYVAGALGFLLIDPFKISLPVLAAILTLMGYSLNDTIVVFDRIREVRGKSPNITAEMVNVSINQTLSRTVLTSFTVFLVVLILYIAGGQGLHAFSFAMLIGIVTGTYSSIYIAAPILVWLHRPHKMVGGRRVIEGRRPAAGDAA